MCMWLSGEGSKGGAGRAGVRSTTNSLPDVDSWIVNLALHGGLLLISR